MTGPAAAQAGVLGELVPGVRVVVVGSGPQWRTPDGEESAGEGGASYVRVDGARAVAHRSGVLPLGVLPLRDRSVRGVVLAGEWVELLDEGARVLAPAGRLVVEPVAAGAVERLEGAGLRVLLNEAGTIIAGR